MLTINPIKLNKLSKKYISFGENQNDKKNSFTSHSNIVDNKGLMTDTFQSNVEEPKEEEKVSLLKKAYKIFFTRDGLKEYESKSYIHLPYMAL